MMTEKDQFLSTMAREFPTTLKVLKAFPTGKAELKPHDLVPHCFRRELELSLTCHRPTLCRA